MAQPTLDLYGSGQAEAATVGGLFLPETGKEKREPEPNPAHVEPVRFRRYFVARGAVNARVWYNLDNRTDGRQCVTMYAKGYRDGANLGAIFPAQYRNNTDLQTDYFEEGTVDLFADHPQYAEARAFVEQLQATRRA